jgi:hypothetical protein
MLSTGRLWQTLGDRTVNDGQRSRRHGTEVTVSFNLHRLANPHGPVGNYFMARELVWLEDRTFAGWGCKAVRLGRI